MASEDTRSEPLQTKMLFRRDPEFNSEVDMAKKAGFSLTFNRTNPILRDSFVIGRYSVLPYYNELDDDLFYSNCKLINTVRQHNYIANFDYYHDVKDYTFETWFDHDFPLSNYTGPFVVKGKTNSKKGSWKSLMFAPDRKSAINIACDLREDSLIGDQGIIYRKFEPLKTFEYGLNDLPFTNEWRFFFLGQKLVDYGYYWSNATDMAKSSAVIDYEGTSFAFSIAEIISQKANFFVLDIAEKASGGWILVEVNDAQMSGLSTIDEERFYRRLAECSGDLSSLLF